MKILIAGCGWLGTALAERRMAAGDHVVGVRRSRSAARELQARRIAAVVTDLSDPVAARQRLPTGLDAIVACQSADGPTVEAYRRAYVEVTSHLLDLADRDGVGRLVYVGSTGVFDQDGGVVDERTAPLARRATARVLLEAERQVLGRARADRVAGCVVRLSGLYGPGRFGIVERVRAGRMTLGPADDVWMNFCHLEDAVRAVDAALDRGRSGAVYHASDAAPARRRDVVEWIARRLSIEPPRAAGDDTTRRRPSRRVSAEASRRELGLDLAYASFREGLAQAPCFS